jgi:hypothetical protein
METLHFVHFFSIFWKKIVAIDTTNNTEGGNTTVEISIMDINDNSPTFDSAGYTFTVGNKLGIIGQVIMLAF